MRGNQLTKEGGQQLGEASWQMAWIQISGSKSMKVPIALSLFANVLVFLKMENEIGSQIVEEEVKGWKQEAEDLEGVESGQAWSSRLVAAVDVHQMSNMVKKLMEKLME